MCNVNSKILHFAAVLGYSARVEALKEWLEEKAVYPMSVCGASALQLQQNRGRAGEPVSLTNFISEVNTEVGVGQYVLVVHVACETTPRPLFEGDEKHHFKYSIKSAQCYHMEKLGVQFFPRFTLSNHPGLVMIPKTTNYMRIIVVDEELPPPVDMHLIRGAIPDRIHEMPYDSGWFMHLQEMTELESLVCALVDANFTFIRVSNTDILPTQTTMRKYYETTVIPRAAKSTYWSGWVGYIIILAAIIWWKWLK